MCLTSGSTTGFDDVMTLSFADGMVNAAGRALLLASVDENGFAIEDSATAGFVCCDCGVANAKDDVVGLAGVVAPNENPEVGFSAGTALLKENPEDDFSEVAAVP